MINTDKKHFTHEELKKALKDFKTTKLDVTDLKVIVLLFTSIHLSTCPQYFGYFVCLFESILYVPFSVMSGWIFLV